MRTLYSIGILFVICTSLASSKVDAGAPPARISYGQRIESSVYYVPDSPCDENNYEFEARQGDVVSITVSVISGYIPRLYLYDGELLVEGFLSRDGRAVTLENYTITNDQRPTIVVEGNAIERYAETTFSLSLTLVTEADLSILIESFTVGTRPSHIVSDGSHVYVSNRDSHNISVLSMRGELMNTIPFDGSPSAMQWDGGRLWVADREGDSVYLFNSAGQELARYSPGYSPISMSYSASNQIMWLALYDDAQIVALNMEGEELTRINLPAHPSTVLASPDSDHAWVALYSDGNNAARRVSLVSLSGEFDETVEYLVHAYPNDLAYGNDQLFVVYGGSNILTIIDPVQGAQQDFEIEGGYIIEVFWDGSYIWLTLDTNAITVLDYDPQNQTIQQLRTFLLDSRPFGINYIEPFIWVSNRGTPESPGNSVTRINTLGLGVGSD